MAFGRFAKLIAFVPATVNKLFKAPQIISKNKILKHLPGMNLVNSFYENVYDPQIEKLNEKMGLPSEYKLKV